MYFIRYILRHVLATTAAIFRVILFLEYKGKNVVSWVAVTPYHLQITIIPVKVIQV
jgi:hypothetical protein